MSHHDHNHHSDNSLNRESINTFINKSDYSNLMNSIKLNDSRDFYGCLLVSQIETVEAVSRLDNQVINVVNKTLLLENMLCLAIDKYNALEETMRLFCSQFESLNIDRNTNTNNNKTTLTTSNDKDEKNTPLKTLVEICSELHENESKPTCQQIAQSTQTESESKEIKEEKNDDKKDDLCSEHTSCFYCVSSNQKLYADDKKPPAIITDHQCEEYKEIQRQFNKRVKYEVNKKFGSYYLAEHQVRELDVKEMHRIRKKVVKLFSPFPLPIKIAWNNAMNSLRQDRHQLKKKRRYIRK